MEKVLVMQVTLAVMADGRWQLNEFDKKVWEIFNYILYH